MTNKQDYHYRTNTQQEIINIKTSLKQITSSIKQAAGAIKYKIQRFSWAYNLTEAPEVDWTIKALPAKVNA